MKTEILEGVPTILPQDVLSQVGKVSIIDVRRPDEFFGELGHIESAQLVTLGPDLQTFLETQDKELPVIFVCRSGGRSGHATEVSLDLGFKHVANMQGGMLLWNHLRLPTK